MNVCKEKDHKLYNLFYHLYGHASVGGLHFSLAVNYRKC